MAEQITEHPPATVEEQGGSNQGLFASFGAVGAGFLSALCCIGPLLFVFFGVGAGLASTFEPLRPLFTLLTAGFLALGFYAVYGRKPKATKVSNADCCASGGAVGKACPAPRRRTRDKALLWTATVLAVTLWSFTYWSRLLV